MTKPTWMITGAHGFLGANAVAHLSPHANVIGITREQHDLTTPESLAKEITEIKPDYLLHAAAQMAGTKLIYISTDAVFSGQPSAATPAGNYQESDQPNPNTVYGESKLAGELHAESETNPLIVRTNFFGWSPTGHRSILEFFVNELRANRSVNGFTNVTTTSLYAHTLLDYIYQLKDHTGIFHITSRDAITKYEFGVKVAKHFDLRESLIKRVEAKNSKDLSLNTLKLENSIGVAVASQDQGLAFAVQQE